MERKGNLGGLFPNNTASAFVQKWWSFGFLRPFFDHFVQL